LHEKKISAVTIEPDLLEKFGITTVGGLQALEAKLDGEYLRQSAK
jgi:hypothetical protein